jgi:hypothetical protein
MHRIAHWQLMEDFLILKKIGSNDIKIPLVAIKKVRVSHNPNRYRDYVCTISTGLSNYTLHSTSFERLHSFCNQANEFNSFVKKIITQLGLKNYNTPIWLGLSKASYYLQLALFVLCMAQLGILLFAFPLLIDWHFLLKMTLILCISTSLLISLCLQRPTLWKGSSIPIRALAH